MLSPLASRLASPFAAFGRTLRDTARFAIGCHMRYAAPDGARRLRALTYPKVVLGGLVAQVGDTVIDGSVKSRLQQLQTAF